LQQHLESNPPPPSSKRNGLPPEIDRVVLKALEKSGGRRHLTLRQLLTELSGNVDTQARTMMAEAPAQAAPAAAPAPQAAHAKTVMGIASPIAAMGPGVAAAGANARTMMAEVPKLPQSAPPPSAPAPMPMSAPVAQEPPRPVAAPAPTPVAAAPAPMQAQAAPAAAAGAAAKKGGFRETAWFKKGEIEEEMAKAQAAVASADPLAPSGRTGQQAIVDENAVDVSAQDRARLSLKTGATQAMAAVKMPTGALPGERMDESEMLAEIDSSKKWLIIAGAIVALVVIGLVIYFATHGGSPKAEAPPPDKPAAVAAAPPAPTPTPPPAPVAPTPPPPSPAASASKAAPSPAGLVDEAATAAQHDDYASAVAKLEQASKSGADPKQVHRVAASMQKGLTAKARQKKDRAVYVALLNRVKRISKKK
jgi:hypothetical protein